MQKSFKDMATRIENATQTFVDNVVDQFGVTVAEAEKVLRIFRKAKAVKLDAVGGRYNLTHGAYWEADVIARTVALEEK